MVIGQNAAAESTALTATAPTSEAVGEARFTFTKRMPTSEVSNETPPMRNG